MLIIERFSSIGGGTGMPLPGLSGYSSVLLTAYTYWAGLAVTVAALAVIYLLLRGRLGLVLTAIRDDEVAARSSGARVGLARLLVFVVAGAGCGAAGAVLAISQLQVQPSAVFSVQWTAEMAFATIIGGLGTIEGPIVGTALFMVLQQTLASYNAWYLIVLGIVAVVIALWSRRGLWGLVDEHLHLRLFPVGYWLWPASQEPAGVPPAVPGAPHRNLTGSGQLSAATVTRVHGEAIVTGPASPGLRPGEWPVCRRGTTARARSACGGSGGSPPGHRVILGCAAERDGRRVGGRSGNLVAAGQGRGTGQGAARCGPR